MQKEDHCEWDIKTRPDTAPFGPCFICTVVLTRWQIDNTPETIASMHIIYRAGYSLVDEMTLLVLDARISLPEFFQNLRSSPMDQKLRGKIGKRQEGMLEIVRQQEPNSSLYTLTLTARKRAQIMRTVRQNGQYVREAGIALATATTMMGIHEIALHKRGRLN